MKAITTKYIGPTNYRGSRIKACDSDGNQVTIGYPYELDTNDAHRKAAVALCDKMHWPWFLVGGHTKDGMVFVMIPDQIERTYAPPEIKTRLEELRSVIRAECISYGEISELEGLAEYIDRDDVELLERAGVPEFPEEGTENAA